MRGRSWVLVIGLCLTAGCAPPPPPSGEPFDVMTALQQANRAPPPAGNAWRTTCRRITAKECW